MLSAVDVVVVGAGIIGRAVAFELAQRKLRVLVSDTRNPGAAASDAAVGFLPVASIRALEGPRFTAAVAALQAHPEFLQQIEAHGGGRVCLEHPGCVQLATSEGGAESLRQRVERRSSQGYAAQYIDGTGVAAELPGIADRFAGAAVFPREAQVDCVKLLSALRLAGAVLGVVTVEGSASLQLVSDGTADVSIGGRPVAAGAIVVAAGWWSRQLCRPLRLEVPIEAERGEGLELAPLTPSPRQVMDHKCVIVPRPGGRVWVIGHNRDRKDSGDARADLVRRASLVWPALGEAEVTRQWSGERPVSLLHHALVCRAPGIANVFVASGHHRSGFLHAPLTARILAAQILGESAPDAARLFTWDRSEAPDDAED